MSLDPAAYLTHVEKLAMSHERKLELIRVVARIMESFVDLAFRTSAEQILLGTSREPITACGKDPLDSGLDLSPTYNAAAGEPAEKSQK